MKRERIEKHKFKRILKMDRGARYSVICKEEKEIANNMSKQLDRFKSTLNRGRRVDKEEIDK